MKKKQPCSSSKMNRRSFFGFLLCLPLVGRFKSNDGKRDLVYKVKVFRVGKTNRTFWRMNRDFELTKWSNSHVDGW